MFQLFTHPTPFTTSKIYISQTDYSQQDFKLYAFIICVMSLNQSADLTKVKQHEIEITPKGSFVEQLSDRSQGQIAHKKYGNMIVLLETDRILITLGPDYICFISAFLCFVVAGIFLIIRVNQAFDLMLLKIGNFLFVMLQILSYLSVAVSNPGIVLQQNLPSQENQEETEVKRYCRKCRINMQKNMNHCRSCDVCIRDYDHHCPWISKCIGGSNLKRFYFFVGLTPFYIIYYMVMIFICFAISATTIPK